MCIRDSKTNLVEYGFRLPSAMDNRPLFFEEFESKINQVVYVSATPSQYEKDHSAQIAEQLIRPTGLVAVSYTHLDVYKRQDLQSTDTV